MFSPYYAWARRGGAADPTNHCAVNVALYGPRGGRWAMTERGRASLVREKDALALGPSAFAWDGTRLVITLDEVTAPLPSRIRGRVTLRPAAVHDQSFALDAAGRHRWRPLAPRARVEVALEAPSLHWSGPAYADTNAGDEPLAAAFTTWDWSRSIEPEGASILYDVRRRDGTVLGLALAFDDAGGLSHEEQRPAAALPLTRWRLPRTTRADAGTTPAVIRTFEDAPFYARSLIGTTLWGRPIAAVHESLSLDRFTRPIVQAMLPFRMPRALR